MEPSNYLKFSSFGWFCQSGDYRALTGVDLTTGVAGLT